MFESWFLKPVVVNACAGESPSEVGVVAVELAALEREVGDMTRNFSIAEIEAMQSGEPREGAGVLEKAIRAKYRRINELLRK
jgi:hypothetical protein